MKTTVVSLRLYHSTDKNTLPQNFLRAAIKGILNESIKFLPHCPLPQPSAKPHWFVRTGERLAKSTVSVRVPVETAQALKECYGWQNTLREFLAAFHQCPRVVVKQALIDRLRNRAFLRVFGNRIVTDRHQVTDFKFVFNTAANGFMGMKMWQAFDHLSFAEALVDEMTSRRGFDRKVVEIIKEVLLQLCWNL